MAGNFKILIIIICCLVLFAGITAAYSIISKKRAQELCEKEMGSKLELLNDSTRQMLERIKEGTGKLSKSDVIVAALKKPEDKDLLKKAQSLLTEYRDANENIIGIELIENKNGKLTSITSGNKLLSPEKENFINKLSNKTTAFSKPFLDNENNPLFFVSRPVYKDDQKLGYILITINFQIFSSRHVNNIKIGEKGYAFIITDEGEALAYPAKKAILKLNISHYEFGKKIIEQKNGRATYQWKNRDKVVKFREVEDTGWILVVGTEIP